MDVLKHYGWEKPFPIQRQSIPIIMSGRDMIGIAKTGSGKTLAFILPMLRHILDQPPIKHGDGPIALILAPARELARQIHLEISKFSKPLNIQSVCCYGGAGIADQIGTLKVGVHCVVGTPGRLIDLLTTGAGKVLSLARVTYMVLDEADRMFDMGFEPQVTKIIQNTRPDRQTVLFSATFPMAVEKLARTILKAPIEVLVGGRTRASTDIAQFVEVRDEQNKFPRLLQLLGEWYEKGNILVFCESQVHVDTLFKELMEAGYSCTSIHGGKDQIERDHAIREFKNKIKTLMVATSVASRGIDVPDLVLVINYDCPNHLEDYIHRVGRTGRAGRKGTAYTFITKEEAKYSPDMVKVLTDSKNAVSPALQKMRDEWMEKVKSGEEKFRRSGYVSKGFTFQRGEVSKANKFIEDLKHDFLGNDDTDNNNGDDDFASDHHHHQKDSRPLLLMNTAANSSKLPTIANPSSLTPAEKLLWRDMQAQPPPIAAPLPVIIRPATSTNSSEVIVINDFPQNVRIRIAQKKILDEVQDATNCLISVRGQYIPPNQPSRLQRDPGTKLYLLVEASTQHDLARGVREIHRRIQQEMKRAT